MKSMSNSLLKAGILSIGAIGLFYFSKHSRQPQTLEQLIATINMKIQKSYSNPQEMEPFKILKKEIQEEQGVGFHILMISSLKKKPTTVEDQPKVSQILLLCFFQDVFDEKILPKTQIIYQLPHHNLIFNKYPVHQLHTLVVSKQFVPQNDPLSLEDFEATYLVMSALDGFAYFNSHKECGASQPRRHFQVLPKKALESAPVLQILEKFMLFNTVTQHQLARLKIYKKINHLIVIFAFEISGDQIQTLYSNYKKLLRELEIITDDQVRDFKYNLIITKRYMIIIERSSSNFGNININAIGYTGCLTVKDEDTLHFIRERSIVDILEHLAQNNLKNWNNVIEI